MRTGKKSVKLQKKILVTDLLFFIIPCFLLSATIILFIAKESRQRIEASQMEVLEQVNASLDQYFQNVTAHYEHICSDYEINRIISTIDLKEGYAKVKARKTMHEHLQESRYLYTTGKYQIEVLGENGYSFSTAEDGGQITVEFPDIEKLKKEAWYSQMEENGGIYYLATGESAEFSRADPDSVIRIVRIMKNFNSGRVVGIMDVNISREALEDLLGGTVFLLDKAGNVVNYDKTAENMIGQKDNCYSVENNSTGWKLIMAEDGERAAWNFGYIYRCIIAAAVVEVLLAFFMSIYNARSISRPVKKLKKDMRLVYEGDLSVRTEMNGIEEFYELNQQFNEMIDRIEELIEQLQSRDEEKRILELQALQAQINPHFLYNTLASIRFLLEMGMEERAEESLLAFGKLLRKTFSDYRELIPLEEEMQNMENYLILMKNRYQDTFEWKTAISEEAAVCMVPRISIQPFVENSILHAFGEKKGTGHIRVEAYVEEQELFIKITDDGVGGSAREIENKLKNPSEHGRNGLVTGIGIQNVQERLQLIFGERYGIRVEDVPDGGICIIMCMPVTEEKAVRNDKNCNC